VTWIGRLLVLCALIGAGEVAYLLGDAVAQIPAPAPSCVTLKAPGDSGIYVNLSNVDSPETIQHVRDAVANGQPRILHWDPADADAHRKASLKGHPTAPGKQRDEYPPAASAEGGAGADVRLITSRDNSTSGQRMGAVMHAFCPGTAFILEP
jgi:Deoxyribonuclease NucA/NucB